MSSTKFLKKKVWKMLNLAGLAGVVQLVFDSDLQRSGWFRSYREKRPVDARGGPLPWCTYAYIHFISPRLLPTFDVFEYGAGNSTRWYAPRVRHVWAVENDQEWMNYLQPLLPGNVTITYQDTTAGDAYPNEVGRDGRNYHLIVVDGRRRHDCTVRAIDQLTPDGVLVLDDSQRPHYQRAVQVLTERGFRRLEFISLAPGSGGMNNTSLFYRPDNCLGI